MPKTWFGAAPEHQGYLEATKMAKTCYTKWLLITCFVTLIGIAPSHAQDIIPMSQQYIPYGLINREANWDWFAPLNPRYLDDPTPAHEGYFFSYERLHWWLGKPDRMAVGNEGGLRTGLYYSTVDYTFENDGSNARYPTVGANAVVLQDNSIDVSYEAAVRGWGNRIEFGFMEDRHGVLVSILDGIKYHREDSYGVDDKRINQQGSGDGLPGMDGIPYNDLEAPDGTAPPGIAPVAPIAGVPAILGIDGLATVHVIFADPFNLLQGFVDGGYDAQGARVTADGVPDDLNGNGIFGIGPDGVVDQGDLVPLAVAFDEIYVKNHTKISGVEVMAMRRKRRMHRGGIMEVFGGVRYLEIDDRFNFLGLGGILADTEVENYVNNRIVGPEIGFRVAHSRLRWTFNAQARVMFGANFQSIRQEGKIADHATPPAPGTAVFLAPSTFYHRVSNERFAPVGEFRGEAALRLTELVSLKVGWSGLVAGGITRSSNSLQYAVPSFGIVERTETLFTQGVSIGIELNR